MMMQVFFLLLLLVVGTLGYEFALIPKTTDNTFFVMAQSGCEDQCTLLNCTCHYEGIEATDENPNPDPDGSLQAALVQQLLLSDTPTLDGIAISVKNADLIGPIIDQAAIPIITFDSDAPNSSRITYVGTDNFFMGQTLASVAKQIRPEGGTFAILSPDSAPNIMDRLRGFYDEIVPDDDSVSLWSELSTSPVLYNRDLNTALGYMEAFAVQNPTVIVVTVGGPMFHQGYAEFYKRNRHRNITIVSADDFAIQIQHLSSGYVQGLVGQIPFEMGKLAAQVLTDIIQNGASSVPKILGTNLITHIQVPLVLPDLHVDNNLIGDLRIIGYILLGLVVVTAFGFGLWTYQKRKIVIVQAAQPVFLILVAMGVVILASTIIPLSMDDGGKSISEHRATWICMPIPWMSCCGLTITFSALFSKTIRINLIVEETRECHRVKVTALDVIVPFSVLLTLNVIVLTLWSALDPLVYVRTDKPGTDGWQRTIATYGACQCDHPWRFLAPLAFVNGGVLILANWQAYKSRGIKSEFAESKYIGICMISLLEALMIGVPILLVVKESPQAFYLVLSFMLFTVCMGVLLLIFVPKMLIQADYAHRSVDDQRKMLTEHIRQSASSRKSSASLKQEQERAQRLYNVNNLKTSSAEEEKSVVNDVKAAA